jgi:amidase
MTGELAFLTAARARSLFRHRRLSPVELLHALIAQAERTEPAINALAFRYFDEALQTARRAERRWQRGTARELEGIPIAVKDESLIAGRITTNGSLLLRDFVPDTTDVVPQRLLDAGAIVHARTTTPEFSTAFVTHSRLHGVTRNPWNTAVTCGGSSGGSGAALAAGSTTLATGSDIAGSIRVPASMNGVVGFRPPYGRVPQSGPYNLDPYSQEGPLARSVEDCRLLQNVIAGPSGRDMASLWPPMQIPVRPADIRGWRIAWSMDLGLAHVAADVRRNTKRALALFRETGATTHEVDLGWNLKSCLTAAHLHLDQIMGAQLRRDFGRPRQLAQLTSYNRAFLATPSSVTGNNVLAELEQTNRMYQSLAEVFEKHQLLIVPTTAWTGVPADFDHSRDTLRIDGREVDPTFGWVLTWPFNTLNRCPILNVPSGLADNGVPTGIQIVGRTYRDADVFQAGAAYERAADGPFVTARNHPPCADGAGGPPG